MQIDNSNCNIVCRWNKNRISYDVRPLSMGGNTLRVYETLCSPFITWSLLCGFCCWKGGQGGLALIFSFHLLNFPHALGLIKSGNWAHIRVTTCILTRRKWNAKREERGRVSEKEGTRREKNGGEGSWITGKTARTFSRGWTHSHQMNLKFFFNLSTIPNAPHPTVANPLFSQQT